MPWADGIKIPGNVNFRENGSNNVVAGSLCTSGDNPAFE